MVLIVKKFVKIFNVSANVPKRWKNLRKNLRVIIFLKPYPNIPEILVAEYGVKWQDEIIVFHTKEIERELASMQDAV